MRPLKPGAKGALVLLFVIVSVAIGLALRGSDERVPATITIPVDGLDAGKVPDQTITVPAAAVAQAARGLAEHSDDARDETPAAAPSDDLAKNVAALAENRRTTEALPTAGASGGVPGCRTSFVRNQSSRRGVRPTVQVLHYTVSPNRPGWSDVDGIVAYFNRSSSQASSHFVIDAEGHCAYIVPLEAKSWTQAGGNPWAVSYEIIATGREPAYLGTVGYAKLRGVIRWVNGRTGIPMRVGRIAGCAPSQSGLVQHRDGGSCWGGHHDIGPFPFAQVARKVLAGATVTATDRATCRKLNWWRRAGRPGGRARANAIRRRKALDKRRVSCTPTGPVKR